MNNESSENVSSLVPKLRSNLNATELLLAKFSSAARAHILKRALKTSNVKALSRLTDTIEAMQTDFVKFKSTADIVLALFEDVSK